jgi:hypothetical protein
MVGWLLVGLILAGVLLWLLNWWANTDAKTARSALFWAIVGICAIFAVVLFASGKGVMAIVPAGFAAWRMISTGARQTSAGSRGDSPKRATMSEEEALDVLGLEKGADDAEVRAAYKKLMAQVHPDKGGSDWVASKLNEARQTLLGK